MAKTYRRDIRIKGKRFFSPRFSRKKDADEWYEKMKRKKQFLKDGFSYTDETNQETVFSYSKRYMEKRMKRYPEATWRADEQRLRTYVLPVIGEMPMAMVTSGQIKSLLEDITDNGKAIGTRTRVKAVLSSLFSSALNENPPIVTSNPVFGIRFDEARTGGQKVPSYIMDADQCLLFLKTAKELGPVHLLVAAMGIMSGLRKSEMLGLTWRAVDFKNGMILVNQKVEQASLTVRPGTKRGENSSRRVGIPQELIRILSDYRSGSRFSGSDDFIFARPSDGRFYNPRELWKFNAETAKVSGVSVTVHGLRHTFGREFVARGGNIKALQAILGHSVSSTTDLYSDLSGKRSEGTGEVVTFDLEKV